MRTFTLHKYSLHHWDSSCSKQTREAAYAFSKANTISIRRLIHKIGCQSAVCKLFHEPKGRAELPVAEVKWGQPSENNCSSSMALKPQYAPSHLKSCSNSSAGLPQSLNHGSVGYENGNANKFPDDVNFHCSIDTPSQMLLERDKN